MKKLLLFTCISFLSAVGLQGLGLEVNAKSLSHYGTGVAANIDVSINPATIMHDSPRVLSFSYNQWFDYDFALSTTILLGLVFGGVSQFGDLFESKFKRIANIKDSSQFLKGHGGFLDRFDSLMIVTPATLFILNLLENI